MNPFRYCLVFLSAFFFLNKPCRAATTDAIVNVPVADLRSIPALPSPGVSDKYQQTQLLMGEQVAVIGSSGAWVQVQAIDQPAFRYAHRWEGYPGWVLHSTLAYGDNRGFDHWVGVPWLPVLNNPIGPTMMQLPLGSRVRVIGNKKGYSEIDLPGHRTGWVVSTGLLSSPPLKMELRSKILQSALLLLDTPYLWGGLTPQDTAGFTPLTGIDCSGLVHLTYRVNGVIVPRDSAEQYQRATKIHRQDLRPGDLIFSAAPAQPDKITHVMLYAGDDYVIEAPNTGLKVRRIAFKEKTGRPLKSVESGDVLPDRVVYFGRLLTE